jgi:gliding motility-associated-like protein
MCEIASIATFGTMKPALGLILFVFLAHFSSAQPANNSCSSATFLCAGISTSGSNVDADADVCPGCEDGASAAGNFCFPVDNTVWYTFSSNAAGGSATVDITAITCSAGTTNGLQAVVIQAGTPCDESTYSSVGSCNSGQANSISISLTGLSPSTQYYILLDGDEGANPAGECGFEIQISGPAVEPDVTVNPSASSCVGATGELEVLVSGGTSPYSYAINNGTFQPSSTISALSAGTYTVQVQDAGGCIYQTTASVPFSNPPVAGIVTTSQASCGNADGEINVVGTAGGTAPYSFSISVGAFQASSTFTGLSAGSYTIVVQDASGCQDTVTAVLANATGITNANVVTASSDCGGANGELTITPVGGTAPYSYSLNGGAPQASNTFAGLSAGSYSVLITDAAGCTFFISEAAVSQEPPQDVLNIILSVNPSSLCDGDQATSTVSITGTFSSATVEFFLNGVSQQSGGILQWTTTPADGDVISAAVTATGACLAQVNYVTSSVAVTVLPVENPTVNMVSDLTSACAGSLVVFTASQTGCTNPNYTWYVNGVSQQIVNTDVFSTSFQQDVQVYVEVTCGGACSTPAVSNVIPLDIQEVSADAGDNQVMIEGGSVQLEGSGTGTSFSWTPTDNLSDPNSADPVAAPEETTEYILTVTNGSCTATDTVIVFVTPPIVPTTVISPNGDDKNDTWFILNIENYPACKITIFDRWGQRVFNSIGYTNENAWDGTNRGLKLPAAVYYYMIELNTGSGDEADLHSGSITLLY